MRPRKSPTSHKPLTESLIRLCNDLSLPRTSTSLLQRRNIISLSRRAALLLPIFQDLLRKPDRLPHTLVLCLAEILAVLLRFRALVHTCSAQMSRTRLALQFDTVSVQFHQLTRDLASLLDILSQVTLDASDDVREWLHLARLQCRRTDPSAIDPAEENLRSDILRMIEDFEREIVPERTAFEALFGELGLGDSLSCKDEIEKLENEIRDGSGGPCAPAMISFLGVIRYSKCVLFGASTPRVYGGSDSDVVVPTDFRCPISLELMRDPVVAASGQTYDRESIKRWFDSGHKTCPKTGKALEHLRLIPNLALKDIVHQWCQDENVGFEAAEATHSTSKNDGVSWNKASLEAAKLTAAYLVEKLSASPRSVEELNRIVHELRQQAKIGAENRAFIAEAGAVPLLVPLLTSEDPSLQVNSVTAILNLSVLDKNKNLIVKSPGALAGVVSILRSGATWQAKENAAALLRSLSSGHSVRRRRIGRETYVVEGLVELVREGPTSSKRDGLATMMSLAGDRDNVGRLVEGGAVEAAICAVGDEDAVEIAVALLEAVTKRGGVEAVWAVKGLVGRMVELMRQGTDRAREAAAAVLVEVCRVEGTGAVEELARMPGVEWLLWGLMSMGSMRTRRKAAALGKMCRRWMFIEQMGPEGQL